MDSLIVSWNADNAYDILLNKLTIRKGDGHSMEGHRRQLMYMKIASMIDIESTVLRQGNYLPPKLFITDY